jgi:hypothetical protein
MAYSNSKLLIIQRLLESIVELREIVNKMSSEQLEQLPPTLLSNLSFITKSMQNLPSKELNGLIKDEIILINNLIKVTKRTTRLIILGANGFYLN